MTEQNGSGGNGSDPAFVTLPMRMHGCFVRALERVQQAGRALEGARSDAQLQARLVSSALYFLHLVTDPATYKEPSDDEEQYSDPRFDWITLREHERLMGLVQKGVDLNTVQEKERGN